MSVTARVGVALGLGVLLLLWAGPLPAAAAGSFTAHMTLHMGVMAVASPLLALGLAGTWLDPGGRHWLLASPILASATELVVVWAWHTPMLHEAARAGGLPLVIEQGSFLAVGVWLWMAAIGGTAADRHHRRWAGVAALIFTSVHMTLLGSLFSFATRPLYGGHGAHGSALDDQHVGGGIMLLVGGLSYLVGGVVLAREGLRSRTSHPQEDGVS